ncbi:MAG: hypothetical protein GC131_00145 [Alphaproteobacteria bacterium]|nr:hypothetical protein [Alphaproteobacteria bacterium]
MPISIPDKSFWSQREITFVTLFGMLASAIFSLVLGEDFGPDFLNYHSYSGYLAFNPDRLVTDIFPSNIQGYLNPYAYAPQYILNKHLPSMAAGFIIGAVHGLCLLAAYIPSRLLLAHWPANLSRRAAFACALFGTISPFFLSGVGSSFSDNLTPILVLLPVAIIMALRFRDTATPPANAVAYYGLLLLAGALLGASIGLKLTNLLFFIGTGVAWFWRPGFSWRFFLGGFAVFLGIVLGFLVVDGWWAWRLWIEFHNPTFPFHNELFKSEMIGPIFTNMPAWAAADNLWEVIAYPFRWMRGIPPETEWHFRDYRYAYLYILAAALVAQQLYLLLSSKVRALPRLPTPQTPTPGYIRDRLWFVSVWVLVSYALWIGVFGAMRYIIPLTLLTGILGLCYALVLVPKRRAVFVATGMMAIVALVTLQRPPFAREKWEKSWNPVTVPEALKQPNTLYMIEGLSFVEPFFADDARFIGFPYVAGPSGLHDRAQKVIKDHTGPIRTLSMVPWSEATKGTLAIFGLRRNPADCILFPVVYYTFQSCKAERITENNEPGPLQLPVMLDFRTVDNPALDFTNGFNPPETYGSWTNGQDAKMTLFGTLPQKFVLKITAYAFGPNVEQLVEITIGGTERKTSFSDQMQTMLLPFDFPHEGAAGQTIKIHIPQPTSPHDLDPSSGDLRKLGLHIQSIEIEPAAGE